MIYSILWSCESFGGAEIYVRKMKEEVGVEYISLNKIKFKDSLSLFFKIMSNKNTFVFHDIRASFFSVFRFFYFKDYFVVHGPGKKEKFTRLFFTIVSWYAKKIVLVSPFIYKNLPNQKFLVLENESNIPVKCNTESYEFIYFGRIEKSKGVDILCSKWEQLGIKRKLHIVGDGKILQELMSTYKVNNYLEFHNSLNHTELGKIIKRCGYYISCSLREGQSLSLMEALGSGMVPVVTRIPTQGFIEKDVRLETLDLKFENFASLIKYYSTIDLEEKFLLHSRVGTYINLNRRTGEWADFWKGLIKNRK